MGRPALPLGTMGEIRCYRLPSGKYRAIANYRDFDGITRQMERVGRTDTDARNRLKAACRDRSGPDIAGGITASTTVAVLAEVWFEEIRLSVETGERSPTTGQLYRDRLDKQVLPAFGALRLREITVSRVDRMLKTVRERHGPGTAKATRTVLSGLFSLAARHDALSANPVREVARVRSPQHDTFALQLEQVWDLRAHLAADQQAQDWDLPDFVDMMLATGLRIGEAAAITWPAVDLTTGTVEVRGTVIRIPGKGLRIKWKPKSRAGWRRVELPRWTLAMLIARRERQAGNDWDVVFPSPLGKLRDPSNTQGDLRVVLTRAGFPDVTSHTFRRTVATLMDRAGLSARAAADQLGHVKISMTQDHYYGRRTASTGAAQVLETVSGTAEAGAQRHG
jgi:integrase